MIPALLLVLSVVIYRTATGLLIQSGASPALSNFAPIAAIALCSAAFLPRGYKLALPLATLFLSDLILDQCYGVALFTPLMLCRYGALVLVGLLGWALQNKASWRTMLPASLAASTFFYLVTNAFSWLTDPGYVKSFGGLFQALTIGLPEYSATPSWIFFRNSLLSDLLFTAAFLLCLRVGFRRPRTHSVLVRAA